jgi:transposase-like protein
MSFLNSIIKINSPILILCSDGLTGLKEAIQAAFPSPQALMKTLYLATFEVTKKWIMPIRNWGKVRGELSIIWNRTCF